MNRRHYALTLDQLQRLARLCEVTQEACQMRLNVYIFRL